MTQCLTVEGTLDTPSIGDCFLIKKSLPSFFLPVPVTISNWTLAFLSSAKRFHLSRGLKRAVLAVTASVFAATAAIQDFVPGPRCCRSVGYKKIKRTRARTYGPVTPGEHQGGVESRKLEQQLMQARGPAPFRVKIILQLHKINNVKNSYAIFSWAIAADSKGCAGSCNYCAGNAASARAAQALRRRTKTEN